MSVLGSSVEEHNSRSTCADTGLLGPCQDWEKLAGNVSTYFKKKSILTAGFCHIPPLDEYAAAYNVKQDLTYRPALCYHLPCKLQHWDSLHSLECEGHASITGAKGGRHQQVVVQITHTHKVLKLVHEKEAAFPSS